MSTIIKIESVTKKYGEKVIIPNLSLQINSGEFFTLLGPSGCGKTTLLRMIAGFNTIEGGSIYFNEQFINTTPPYKRNIGMVFQNYAIFPHMTVRKNIEYGLKQRKIPKDELQSRVNKIMDIVKISEYAEKTPNQLSGGQQQRVALARAIVIHPTVLLMDEPLSNLDAKLRVEMRSAIRDIQKKIGITTVYVTHDQEEALAVSDRIAVMNYGELQQVGTPVALYRRPANLFVATFVGTSNVFDATLNMQGNQPCIVIGKSAPLAIKDIDPAKCCHNMPVKVSVRPEEFSISGQNTGFHGKIKSRVFLGRYTHYNLVLPDGTLVEFCQTLGQAEKLYNEGDTVQFMPDVNRLNVFDSQGHSLMREVTDETS